MSNGYSRLKAEQQSGIPWSEMIALLEERLDQPTAYVEEVWFGQKLAPEEKVRRENDPQSIAYEKEARLAIKRYRMSRNAPVNHKAGNVLFGVMESLGIVQRDQAGNVYVLRKDATFTKLT